MGDTPFHLVKPILKRLNAKQLALLESNSLNIMPQSDELWGELIERDFPDRPPYQAKSARQSALDPMPRKTLYCQYSEDKAKFLATSAQRLRTMTEKLQREKTKNSIVTVLGILADPTIRRRPTLTRQPYAKAQPKLILGKARRDVSQRSLMFNGANRRPVQAEYVAPKPLRLDLINPRNTGGIYSQRASPPVAAPLRRAPERQSSPEIRKRRPPSVFLDRKRPAPKRGALQQPQEERPRVALSAKSSIFH